MADLNNVGLPWKEEETVVEITKQQTLSKTLGKFGVPIVNTLNQNLLQPLIKNKTPRKCYE